MTRATRAATALNHLIADAASRPVVLGEARPTSRHAQEPRRPYFRLVYQRFGAPTSVPGRLEGLLDIYCFGVSPEEAWHEATSLSAALGLTHDRAIAGVGALADFRLAGAWEALPDPTGGGLVFCRLSFSYYDQKPGGVT